MIGDITLNGTLALMLFGGLGMGLLAGTIWVIVSPWVPGHGLTRALVTAGAAIAIGTPPLIQRSNPDFIFLGHDPIVVALLIGLVGLVGLTIALVDDVLDRFLAPVVRGSRTTMTVYLVVTLIGLGLIIAARRRVAHERARVSCADPGRLGPGCRGRLHADLVGPSREGSIIPAGTLAARRIGLAGGGGRARSHDEPPAHPYRSGHPLVTLKRADIVATCVVPPAVGPQRPLPGSVARR